MQRPIAPLSRPQGREGATAQGRKEQEARREATPKDRQLENLPISPSATFTTASTMATPLQTTLIGPAAKNPAAKLRDADARLKDLEQAIRAQFPSTVDITKFPKSLVDKTKETREKCEKLHSAVKAAKQQLETAGAEFKMRHEK